MKVYQYHNWEYWYDRAYRCWFAMKVDSEGNQIGDCIDAYTNGEILQLIEKEIDNERKTR